MNRKKTVLFLAIVVLIAVIVGVAVLADNTSYKAVVCIDAGHGGDDVGAIGDSSRYEKDDNLRLALKVQSELKNQNIKVVMTRDSDATVSLQERCNIANSKRADMFVALHRNSAGVGNGVEIWVESTKPDSDTVLAQNIMDALEKVGVSRNRGVRFGTEGNGKTDYYVNEHTDMPSCLVEMGFITSDKDNSLFDKNLDSNASAIADAIVLSLEQTGVITTETH